MINVLFQIASHYSVNRLKIKEAISNALTTQVKRDTEVSVSIVGDRQMRQLNKKYRNLDQTTDVLSFSLNESVRGGIPFVEPPDNILRLGDIIISYPQAIVEASTTNSMVDDTVIELALHGLNHLLGIHHPE